MLSENEFFTKVIEKYSEIKNDPIKIELLQSNSIRELMEIYTATGNYEFFQKAMPIVLSLFNDKCEDPFDAYSKKRDRLNDNEIDILNDLLKENIED